MRLVRQRDELKQVTKLAEDLKFHELKNHGSQRLSLHRFYRFTYFGFMFFFQCLIRVIPGARFILHTRAHWPIGQRRRGFNLAKQNLRIVVVL